MTTVVIVIRAASGTVSEFVLEDGPLEMGRLTRHRVPQKIAEANAVSVSVGVRIPPMLPDAEATLFAVGLDLSDRPVTKILHGGPLPTQMLTQALIPLLRGSLSLAARRRGETALSDAAPSAIRCLRFTGARRCRREADAAEKIGGVSVHRAEIEGVFYLVLAGDVDRLSRHRSKGEETALPTDLEPALFAAYAMARWPGPDNPFRGAS